MIAAGRACAECGRPFMPERRNAVCCSTACQHVRNRSKVLTYCRERYANDPEYRARRMANALERRRRLRLDADYRARDSIKRQQRKRRARRTLQELLGLPAGVSTS